MKRSVGWWFLAAALVLPLAAPAMAAPKGAGKRGVTEASEPKAKPLPPLRTVAQALKQLAVGEGEALEQAKAFLRARPDLLPKQAKGLADLVVRAPADAEVAGRVLELAREREMPGCMFLAGLVDAGRPGLTEGLLFDEGAEVPRCPAMADALAGLLRGLPDTTKVPAAERTVMRALEVARTWRDPAAARTSCRYVLAGSDRLRREALATILAAKPAGDGECLVQAYAEESARSDGDADLRAELLRGLVTLSGVDSVPTLRLALDRPEDRDLACNLLQGRGPTAVEGLIFAIRTGDARSEGVRACLDVLGESAIQGVLPLMDHPSARIRAFAIEFLGKHRSSAARDDLQRHFLDGTGPVDRQVLLGLLASYPPAEVEETLREALSSDDGRMRSAGLDAVESSRATNLLKLLHEIAQEDPDASLRRRALEVAWHLHDPTVVPLARKIATYEVPLVATMAIRIVGLMGGKEDGEIVGKLLGHKEPEIVAAAVEAGWFLSLQEPRKGRVEFRGAPKVKESARPREVECAGVRTRVIGKKGPIVIVLPGGPAMDLSWAWHSLRDLADDAVVAFVEPTASDAGPAPAGLVLPGHLACVRQALGGGRLVLVSHGLGGTWALSLASALPDEVAGVAAVMAPLPGRLGDVDDALRAALKEPFKAVAYAIADRQAAFVPEAINAYFSRLFAPAMAGKSDPASVLGVAWDVQREGRAAGLLDSPEVRFVPADSHARFLLVVPAGLSQAATDAYGAVAAAVPDRVAVQSWEGCGFLPEVACPSKTVKALAGFVRAAVAGSSK